MAWKLDGKGSIYSQIIDVILRRIVTGQYPAGSKLDSVREFASEAGVNPNTMQRALAELERTGIINTQRTSGKFVTEDQSMIDEIRAGLIKEAVEELFNNLEELGVKKEEVLDYIEEVSK